MVVPPGGNHTHLGNHCILGLPGLVASVMVITPSSTMKQFLVFCRGQTLLMFRIWLTC